MILIKSQKTLTKKIPYIQRNVEEIYQKEKMYIQFFSFFFFVYEINFVIVLPSKKHLAV